jgi:hypothetical protein
MRQQLKSNLLLKMGKGPEKTFISPKKTNTGPMCENMLHVIDQGNVSQNHQNISLPTC